MVYFPLLLTEKSATGIRHFVNQSLQPTLLVALNLRILIFPWFNLVIVSSRENEIGFDGIFNFSLFAKS